jgi:glutaredoxin-related protein
MQQNQSDISPDVLQQATSVVTQSRIVILIKGTPQAPKCGFSKRMLHLLVNNGVQFTCFNVMDVKEKPIYNAFKQIAGLPTFPQVANTSYLTL